MMATSPEAAPPRMIPASTPGSARWLWLLGGGVGAGLLVLYFFNPIEHRFYPVCQFYQLTHLHCPGCGSLRALHQLTHGHVSVAFHSNPLLVVSLPFLLWFGIRKLCLASERTKPQAPIRPVLVWSIFAVIVVFGILRNLPWPAFVWMAP